MQLSIRYQFKDDLGQQQKGAIKAPYWIRNHTGFTFWYYLDTTFEATQVENNAEVSCSRMCGVFVVVICIIMFPH